MLKKFLLVSVPFILGLGFSPSLSTNKKEKGLENESGKQVYYINNQRDFDTYKNKTFPAGSTILFAKGAIFNGQFAPHGSGTAGHPIVVAAYDRESKKVYTEDIDGKPIISGHGQVRAPFLLENEQYWEVSNLEITNSNGRRLTQTIMENGSKKQPTSKADRATTKYFGIHVVARNPGVTHHIVISHCYVHDVTQKAAGKDRGGIFITAYGDSTRFGHVRIVGNVVENVEAVGIHLYGGGPQIMEKGYNPWTDVVVRGNRVQRTGRSGIILQNSKDPIIEYNTVAYPARISMAVNIFNFNTRGAIMQYNEVYGNYGGAAEHDRGALDADFNSEGTIIQYNYSHDNNYFAMIQRKYNKGVTIRYNISQNELLGSYYYGFARAHELEDVQIYNNTHYFRKGVNGVIFVGGDGYVGGAPSKPRIPIESTFKNNIFYFGGRGTIGAPPAASTKFDHNLFYHVRPIGTHALTADPRFKDAGAGRTDIDMHVPGRLAGYQLQPGSPAIDAGIEIANNGGKDFWGHPLYNRAPDLGAYEVN